MRLASIYIPSETLPHIFGENHNGQTINLVAKIYKFYINLYEKGLDLAVIKNQNGNLKKHYDEFIRVNSNGVCPFCGIDTLRSYEMVGHEAYDHFLPKENYPLYAINFENLIPTCHDCNSTYKTRDIPILTKNKKNKRKAFYPYSTESYDIEFKITVNIENFEFYEHDHIDLDIKSEKNKEKISTWKEVYDIEKRYKDQLTNVGVGKYWLVELLDEMTLEERKKAIEKLPNKLIKAKYKNKNFLKVPFLLGCNEIGLFD